MHSSAKRSGHGGSAISSTADPKRTSRLCWSTSASDPNWTLSAEAEKALSLKRTVLFESEAIGGREEQGMKGASSASFGELLFCVALAERWPHAGAWKGGGPWIQMKIVKAQR